MKSNLEALAISTYKNNLLYFQEFQKDIYNKLAAFDAAIEGGYYQSRYDLLLTNDYLDVLELQTNNYLYGSNSKEYAKLASKSVDFKKDSNVYKTFRDVTIKEEDLQKYAKVDIRENNLSGFAPILHFIEKHIPKNSDLESLRKFIFFGVGLGTHLIEIDNKIAADIYFIIEDDLELFKLSLFSTPYYKLASHAELIFSVFDSKEEFRQPAIKFLERGFEHNHYLKYFIMRSHKEEKLKEFHLQITSQSHNLFYYNAILKQYLKPLDYLRNNFNFINLLKTQNTPLFDSKPVLLIAAGPSLRKNIEWLKRNHHKFIIVALSATLNILEKENISPDIVTHIDGFHYSIAHFDKLQSLAFLQETTFLISARTPPEIVNRFEKKNIFFFENGTSYKKDFAILAAPCVGSTTYLLLITFGIKELYLLGLDLALDPETGSTHSADHRYNQKLDLTSAQKHEDTMSFQGSVIQTTGNFKKDVHTTPNLLLSIDSISTTSQNFKKKNQNVYNLNDGAYFKNTIAKDIATIKIDILTNIEQKKIDIEIHDTFIGASDSKLTHDEIITLKERVAYAKTLQSIVENHQTKQFTKRESFETSLINLLHALTKNSSDVGYDLSLVFLNYFKFIFTFIFDFFNAKDLQNKDSYAHEINQLLCRELLRVLNIYIDEINNTISEEEK